MPYTRINFKSKKALKDALANGDRIGVFQPNNIFNVEFEAGEWITLEGPHYPLPHRWWASAQLDNDLCIKAGSVK
jgi:hypothetical protein